jgi:hypothetical protein
MPFSGQTTKPLVRLPRDPAGCWEYLGPKTDGGYGKKTLHKETVMAHRWVWEMLFGPIPAGLVIHHECQNPGCVNPQHLRACSQAENVRESVTCKLTPSDVADIKKAKPDMRTPNLAATLAQQHGCSRQLVHDIWNGRAWARARPFYGRRKSAATA